VNLSRRQIEAANEQHRFGHRCPPVGGSIFRIPRSGRARLSGSGCL
jgi:hypothetical protein